MKKEEDYLQDIATIRSMMERSSKFLSLSGASGILIGIYALVGASIAYFGFGFYPTEIININSVDSGKNITALVGIGSSMLLAAVLTGIVFSSKKARKQNQKIWNHTARQLLATALLPLVSGGLILLFVTCNNLLGLAMPLSLVFYGLALYSASAFTFKEIKYLGVMQVVLGIISFLFIAYSLCIWMLGFGVLHIAYGIYLHTKYEK